MVHDPLDPVAFEPEVRKKKPLTNTHTMVRIQGRGVGRRDRIEERETHRLGCCLTSTSIAPKT